MLPVHHEVNRAFSDAPKPTDREAVLAKLPRLETLSLGEYPVTDEILGYAGQ